MILKDQTLDWRQVFITARGEKQRLVDEFRTSNFAFGKAAIRYLVLDNQASGQRTLCIKVSHGSYDGTLLRIFDEQLNAIARGTKVLTPVNSFESFIDWSYGTDRKESLDY